MEKLEAYFIQHCDNESCDLGRCAYTCPHCNDKDDNYEVWWEQDEIMDGKPNVIDCLKCQQKININWDAENYIYYTDKAE